ncbi:MAG: hypothetical protein EG825_00440 [Rhodocyclaceae bacterium]|nr:hypothetical protein [Rhodocyclaceae bacterium]
MRISEFDLWQPGYGNASVKIYVAGTTTLADVFTDEACTIAADNPQTLQSRSIDGTDYGKFSVPLYVESAYQLEIDSTDTTGIERPPLTTLDGADASSATVVSSDASRARSLADRFGDDVVAEDFGTFGASASTNNSILSTAISAAASNGGGEVILPDGTITYTNFTLPAGVVLKGKGIGVTILQSQTADDTVTISGDGAGFRMLTLDGVNLQAGSVGVFSKANDQTVFDDVLVRRFETGIYFKGGRYNRWNDLSIDNCTNGAKLHGDSDSGNGADGDQWRNNQWLGGMVTVCTGVGIEISYEDRKASHNTVSVGFESNTGTALKLNGARYTNFDGCWWASNTTNWIIQDDSLTTVTDNTVIGLRFNGGEVDTGTANFSGTCQDVVLQGMELAGCTMTLSLVTNPIVAEDCTEDSSVSISGVDGNKWARRQRIMNNPPATAGVTTDATATEAWAINLEPGQVVDIRAVVIGRQRNGEGYATYHIARSARRPGSKLAYQAQTANFTLGDTLTGGTSGAKARIVADSDSGATGTLTLIDIVGTFQNNEIITGALGGSANVNGTITNQNAALLGSTTSIQAAVESAAAWACDFAENVGEIQVNVTGEAAKTIEWTVSAEVVSS